MYAQDTVPRRTFSESLNYDNSLTPIRVTFKDGNHYNSVVTEDHDDTIFNKDEAGEFEDAILASLG